VNKKKQKNFMTALRALGDWRLCPLRPPEVARRMKFFARFFSKKRCLLADACTVMTVRTRRSPDQRIMR
jgi:hypothetical protein